MKKDSAKQRHRKRVESPFAKNLSRVLAERGLSLRAAAEIAGIAQSVMSSWTAGAQPADLLAVQRLAQGLGVNFEWLLTGSVTHVSPADLALTEIFEEHDGFSGIYRIEAKKLTRKK